MLIDCEKTVCMTCSWEKREGVCVKIDTVGGRVPERGGDDAPVWYVSFCYGKLPTTCCVPSAKNWRCLSVTSKVFRCSEQVKNCGYVFHLKDTLTEYDEFTLALEQIKLSTLSPITGPPCCLTLCESLSLRRLYIQLCNHLCNLIDTNWSRQSCHVLWYLLYRINDLLSGMHWEQWTTLGSIINPLI